MDSGVVFVVAPWGDPGYWWPVKYSIAPGRAIVSRTSLLPLVEYICDRRGASTLWDLLNIMIVVGDSLWTSTNRVGSLQGSLNWGAIKDEVVRFVRKKFEEMAKECKEENKESCLRDLDPGKVDIAVCPAIYTDKVGNTYIEFKGSLQLYTLCVYLELLRRAVSAVGANRRSEEVEIWVDLTHGINYMPSSTLLAVQASVRVFKEVGI